MKLPPRLACLLHGHDWWNRSVTHDGVYSEIAFMELSISIQDDEKGVTKRAGTMDLCFRCGKQKWTPTKPKLTEAERWAATVKHELSAG